MKKQLLILSSFALVVGALSSCTILIPRAVSEPDRQGNLFSIDMVSVYSGRDRYEAVKNTKTKVTTGLKSVKSSVIESEFDGYTETVQEIYGETTVYKDGVSIEGTTTNFVAIEGASATDQSSTFKVDAYIDNEVCYYSYESYKPSSGNDNGIMVYYDFDEDPSVLSGLENCIPEDGKYGLLSNGNGVCYSVDISNGTVSGYDQNGNSISVPYVDYEETLITYNGNPKNGTPYAIYSFNHREVHYDENHIFTPNQTMTVNLYSETYYITCGTRSSYPNGPALVNSMKNPRFTEMPTIKLNEAEATLGDDGFSSLGTWFFADDIGLAADEMKNSCSKSTGVAYNDELHFKEGYAYELRTYGKVAYVGKDASDNPKKIVEDLNVACSLSLPSKLPEGLKAVTHEEKVYLYCESSCSLALEGEFSAQAELSSEVARLTASIAITSLA